MVTEYDRLAEASRIIAKAMARIEGLDELEQEIILSGQAAARAAEDGEEGLAVAIGVTIDAAVRAFASFIHRDAAVRDLGDPRDVLSWTIAYFRRRSPELGRHLAPRPLTFRRLPGRLDA